MAGSSEISYVEKYGERAMSKKRKLWLVAAGTTESVEAVRALLKAGCPVLASSATSLGRHMFETLERDHKDCLELLEGRKDREEWIWLMREKRVDRVLDATHPFAVDATRELKAACHACQIPYFRYLRKTQDYDAYKDRICWVKDAREAAKAAARLAGPKGHIFLTTGVRTLAVYRDHIPDFQKRCYARILDTESSKAVCREIFQEADHWIAQNPPFDADQNEESLRRTQAAVIVSKDSAQSGGVTEKLEAARRMDIPAVLIKRPAEEGIDSPEMLWKVIMEDR